MVFSFDLRVIIFRLAATPVCTLMPQIDAISQALNRKLLRGTCGCVLGACPRGVATN